MKRGSGFPNPKSHSRLIKFMEIKAVKAITEMVKTFPPPKKKKRERKKTRKRNRMIFKCLLFIFCNHTAN